MLLATISLSIWQFGSICGASFILAVIMYLLGVEDGRFRGRTSERAWRAEQEAKQTGDDVTRGLRVVGGHR